MPFQDLKYYTQNGQNIEIPKQIAGVKRLINTQVKLQKFDLASDILAYVYPEAVGVEQVELVKLKRNIHMYNMNAGPLFSAYQELAKFDNAAHLNIGHLIGSGLGASKREELEQLLKDIGQHKQEPNWLHVNQALVHSKVREWDKALTLWSKVLETKPDNSRALYGTVECLTRQHTFKEAKAFIAEKLKDDPKNPSILSGLITYQRHLFLRKEAVETCKLALSYYPDDRGFLQTTIINALELNELELATECIDKISSLVKIPFQKVFPRYNYLVESEQFDAARKLLEECLELYPANTLQIKLKLGSFLFHPGVLKNQEDIDTALTYNEQLYAEYPHSTDAKVVLSKIYVFAGLEDKAACLIAKIPRNLSYKIPIKCLWAWKDKYDGDLEKSKATWSELIKERDVPAVFSPINDLRLISKDQKMTPEDIIVFSVVRDEHYRLSAWLDYYRNLGVTKFVFIDNDSSDGTDTILLEQEDVILYATTDTYTQSFNGMRWVNHLLEHYTAQHQNWCIYADVDEYLLYPEVDKKPLPILLEYLTANDYEGVRGFMLDVFDPVTFEIEITDKNPLEGNLYFYNQYYFNNWEYAPYSRVSGGLRTQLYDNLNIILTKTPIIKGGGQIKFLASSHIITPAKIADVTCTFIHLKYSSQFIERAAVEAARKVHFKGAKRFKMYYEKRDQFKKIMENFSSDPKFVKFESAEQLHRLGVIEGAIV